MILKLLKNNKAYHFLLIPLTILALWFRILVDPVSYTFSKGENAMPLYAPLDRLLSGLPLLSNIIAIVLMLALAFIILRMDTRHDFIPAKTFLTSYIFILIVSGFVNLHTLHPVYFGTLFLLLTLDRIFSAYHSERIYANAFEAGFLIGAGSLFYFSLLFYFPIIWIGFLLLRKNPEWRYFVLSLIGVALPWLFTFSFYYLTDLQKEPWNVIGQNIITPNSFINGDLNAKLYLAFLVLIALWSSVVLLVRYGPKKISARKYFNIFFVIFLISLSLPVVVPAVSGEIFVIMAVPLTFIVSNHLIFIKDNFWGDLFILLFLGIIIYMQF